MSVERKNQMLKRKDRLYLEGELEYPHSESRSRRERELSDRVYGALDDFQFLQRRAKGRVWENRLSDPDPTSPIKARDGMAAAMAIFFEIHQANNWNFEETVRRAIEGAYSYGPARRGIQRKIVDDVELRISTHDPLDSAEIKKRVRRKLQNGEELTDYEIAEAVKTGDLDTTRWLRDYIREQQGERAREEWLDGVKQEFQTYNEDDEEGN